MSRCRDHRFDAPTGDGRRDRRRVRRGARRRRARRHARRGRPQRGAARSRGPTCRSSASTGTPRRSPRRPHASPSSLGAPRAAPVRRPRFDDARRRRRRPLSGALFDLGVSSPQLDRAERGFSYRHDGPLDMRMDTDLSRWSAADVVNGYDDRRAGPRDPPLRRRALRRPHRQGDRRRPPDRRRRPSWPRSSGPPSPRPPAAPAAIRRQRTFQAIRIEVNGELDVLPDALDAAIEATGTGGRIAVLSYHSGEDRIVKERLRRATGACDCPPDLPCVCGAVQTVRLVRGVPKRPSVGRARRQPACRVGAPAGRRAGDADDGRRLARSSEGRKPPRPPLHRVFAGRRRRRRHRPARSGRSCPLVPKPPRRGERRDPPRRRGRRADALRRHPAHAPRRAAAGDRPARGARHRAARALRRAAPAARRAALAHPPGDRGRRAGHGRRHRTPSSSPSIRRTLARGHRRRRHRRRGHRRPSTARIRSSRSAACKAVTDGRARRSDRRRRADSTPTTRRRCHLESSRRWAVAAAVPPRPPAAHRRSPAVPPARTDRPDGRRRARSGPAARRPPKARHDQGARPAPAGPAHRPHAPDAGSPTGSPPASRGAA